MLVEVKVPVLSESVADATLISWHKRTGDHVNRSENLIDIETDKVVLELPAPSAGVLTKVLKNDGATVTSGEVIAMIETEATGVTDVQPLQSDSQPAAATEKKASIATEKNTENSDVDDSNQAIPMLMPAARKLAEENNLKATETSAIKGSGLGGRIIKEDVQAYMERKSNASLEIESKPETIVTSKAGMRTERRVAMSRLRQRIAERLIESQSTAAILTTFNEVNMQAIIDLRTRYRAEFEKEYGVKLGFMSFFIKAVIAALKKYPVINASVEGNEIIYHDFYDIGIAVGSPRGLVVPIIRDADRLTLAEIELQIADFAQRAQNGKLTIEELSGGTFSITNGGVFGSMLSTPIINPPQSAILGIHATKERPVVENGQIVIRPMNYLALSYDHRIIDGREAVLSLVAMKEALEYPMSPLLEKIN
ncbi:2-oxoglutarate dehydrogenase complex dihydrolipoyllysine-residue succinyltransferase [Nitrosomonas ureae]|uniref:Dihydrolipoyllysine-residue succinyltransferase component of 2-oxoglutarate dehydrogenase complex n=1 Tax=Nitrosomonas ureae TaxID=44577 RepID=A0A0S3AM96_9PROT|nr:2-oxoglutarate dehydrogenase complex dihydrolipoyllysine-residue succinyltransferase [Nitrosomonas ureae]ALQ52274.1 dihydrolipoamide succinyltransferase [Nitrosomonas ureae]SDT92393.1 2-oxoglutarate dehydrogenase E2 component [Nitrosomonas ureae]SOD20847.1 2-oxoglutarate dehydrogenase E2 component [Nitrosomonas ureae]